MAAATLDIASETTGRYHTVRTSLDGPAEMFEQLRPFSSLRMFGKAEDHRSVKNRLLGFSADKSDLDDLAEIIKADPQLPTRITVGDLLSSDYRLRTESLFTHRVQLAALELVRERFEKFAALFVEPEAEEPNPQSRPGRPPGKHPSHR